MRGLALRKGKDEKMCQRARCLIVLSNQRIHGAFRLEESSEIQKIRATSTDPLEWTDNTLEMFWRLAHLESYFHSMSTFFCFSASLLPGNKAPFKVNPFQTLLASELS
jgi:hypothetical protein